jgi:hypothetical protein
VEALRTGPLLVAKVYTLIFRNITECWNRTVPIIKAPNVNMATIFRVQSAVIRTVFIPWHPLTHIINAFETLFAFFFFTWFTALPFIVVTTIWTRFDWRIYEYTSCIAFCPKRTARRFGTYWWFLWRNFWYTNRYVAIASTTPSKGTALVSFTLESFAKAIFALHVLRTVVLCQAFDSYRSTKTAFIAFISIWTIRT